MPATLSGAQKRTNLQQFVTRWGGYAGSERAEAQTFLNELFACYGTDRRAAGVRFEDPQPRGATTGFVDAIFDEVAIIEMKKPGAADRLDIHRGQALNYWRHSADSGSQRPATRYVVLCAFSKFEIWEPGAYPLAPRKTLNLVELPDAYEALDFLARQRPVFTDTKRQLTLKAAEHVVGLYGSVVDRPAASAEVLQDFILQTVWTLFASSLGMLPGNPVGRIVHELRHDTTGSRSSAAELGYLYELLNTADVSGQGGVYSEAVYVNGGLFARPAHVHLERGELDQLATVAAYDWSQVDPTIFGSLLEGFLPRDRAVGGGTRTQFGVHYTHESDILKIVGPSIIDPITNQLAQAATVADVVAVIEHIAGLQVLDPACGCGNFLYIAYRELRELEALAHQHLAGVAATTGTAAPDAEELPRVTLDQLHGIELDPFAVKITRVVLWMGQKIAADRHGVVENPLPLPALDTIVQADALRTDWPAADVIIGNPPFNGSQNLRRDLGADYVDNFLKPTYGAIYDYCAYWFQKTSDHLPIDGRAGLVGTNSIAQGRNLPGALGYVTHQGGVIIWAVSDQKWPGDANVHVAIVNWIHQPSVVPAVNMLDAQPLSDAIAADLVPAAISTIDAVPLEANNERAFEGVIPVGSGFILDGDTAASLRARNDAPYYDVVKPYLIGRDIAEHPAQEPSRWIIDFGYRSLEEVQQYPVALDIVIRDVKPIRDTNRRSYYKNLWWRFGEPRREMRGALAGLPRYLAVNRVGKRFLFTWCTSDVVPSDALYAIALDEDYHFGILGSGIHQTWALRAGSTLEDRPRYMNEKVFDTFPWPDATPTQREVIAEAGLEVLSARAAACTATGQGLTVVYNTVDDGGHQALANAHTALDRAVATAYGWPDGIDLTDPVEVIPRLMIANAAAANDPDYAPFPPLPTATDTLF